MYVTLALEMKGNKLYEAAVQCDLLVDKVSLLPDKVILPVHQFKPGSQKVILCGFIIAW